MWIALNNLSIKLSDVNYKLDVFICYWDYFMKIAIFIPTHLDSSRFPRKALYPFHGLPMVEHVRRRTLLFKEISDVYVTTCDKEISDLIESCGGDVIMTSSAHKNGTTRVAEAIKSTDCTHAILVQGDEPLLLPKHLKLLTDAIKREPNVDSWNATSPIEKSEELDQHSLVKCSVSESNRILYCFRRNPSYGKLDLQKNYTRKLLGLIAYKAEFLDEFARLPASRIEISESIEQMRIIESGHRIYSVPVFPSLPSVNEPEDVDVVLEYFKANEEQQSILAKILG